MTDIQRWRRVEDVCDAALNRDARERTAFVAAECGGDEALRQEVEALLAHAQTAEGFLAAPIGAVAAHALGEHGASLVGRQVGAYQIVSLLGTGGMGEVYRARDTTLGRDVAIKVLPKAFTSDPERRARFEREARLLAALNHPHIGAIYGLEDIDGVRALVLELVEGPTLADLMAGHPSPEAESLRSRPRGSEAAAPRGGGAPRAMKMTDALAIARQIAEALEAAHEKGIVHRDLKPANVKITPEGVVKVLDFGLAKAAAGDGSTPDLTQSPTITIGGTRDGIILGTAAYMSPEPARGKPVDKRTDIWAFGCLLYEMLTGRVAFPGETMSDTIAAILDRDPSRALGFFNGNVLKTIDASGGPVRTICDVAPGPRGGTWSPDGVIVFGSVSRGLFSVSANGGPPTPLTTPDPTHGERGHRFPSFRPDGRHFLYWATPSNTILLGSLDSKETTRLLTAESQAVYVAPGSLLFGRQGTLMAQPFDAQRRTLTGEAVPVAEQVLRDSSGAAAFDASPGGVLAYRTATLGATTQLTWVDRGGKSLGPVGQPGRYRNPEISPDGARVSVEAVDAQARTQDVWLLELARGVASRLTFDPGNDIYPIWSPDGTQILFGSDRDGGVFNLYQKRADGVGAEEPVLKSSIDMAPNSWSPDGRVVVYRTGGSTPFNLGILSLVGERTPHLFDPVKVTQVFGQVSPDGRWLAYNSVESGRYEIYVQSFPAPGGGMTTRTRETTIW